MQFLRPWSILCVGYSKLWAKTRTNKPKKVDWQEEEVLVFNQIKDAIITDALSYFNTNLETVLEVDADPDGAGAVLSQFDEGNPNKKHVISF